MRGAVRLSVVAAGLFGAYASSAAQQQSSAISIAAFSSPAVRAWDEWVFSRVRTGELRQDGLHVDPALPGRTLERFQQFSQGVPVWGADVVRDAQGGVTQSIFGELVENIAVSAVPALSPTQAGDVLMTIAGAGAAILRAPQLTFVRLRSGEYRLVYSAVVAGSDLEPSRLFIDADTGNEVLRISELHSQTATAGTAHGVLGDRKKISVSNENGTYIADDRLRPPSLLTFDMRGNLNRTRSVIFDGAPLFPSDRAQDADNDWTDVAQVDAHVHVGWTYDYLFKRFGRRGLDDRDRPIRIITNAVTQQGALIIPPAQLEAWVVQAFWCDSCGPGSVGVIFFGNGFPEGYTLGGRHYTYFAGALDIVAHELAHGVTDSSSNLIYQDESGALNESFSDVIGTSVEFYYHPQGDGKGRADYVLGEDISTGVARGEIDGDRSMANPTAHGNPDHYSQRFRGTEDDGGVHINSSIPNHAFYLAVEGGTNRTSGLSVQGVGAANREQIEKVFYRAFTFLLPSSARFSTARAATIQAARDLYGPNSTAERAMTQAWTAVGVN